MRQRRRSGATIRSTLVHNTDVWLLVLPASDDHPFAWWVIGGGDSHLATEPTQAQSERSEVKEVVTANRSERSSAARIAAHSSWAHTADRTARTEPARTKSPGSLDYWLRHVDPDEEMTYAERVKRAENARSAYMGRLSKRARRSTDGQERR